MGEYTLVAMVVIFAGSTLYLARERFLIPRKLSSTEQYTQALRDLLDGKPESAFAKLRQVVTAESDNLDAYLRLGQILREHKQTERALQIHKDMTLRTGLSRNDKIAILRQIVLDYQALDDLTTAQAAVTELLSLDSRDRWGNARLLEIQEKSGMWEEAYETASTILRLDSNRSKKSLARYKYQVGKALCLAREYHKARTAFKESISIDPVFVPAYLALGDAYYKEERFEDAVTFWNKLIEAVPSKGHLAIERLKKTLFELGRFGDIAEACESVLHHDPRNSGARKALADFHEKKGDAVAAIELYERLAEDISNDSEVIVSLARLYLEQGESKKLEKLLRQIEQTKDRGNSSESGSIASDSTSTAKV